MMQENHASYLTIGAEPPLLKFFRMASPLDTPVSRSALKYYHYLPLTINKTSLEIFGSALFYSNSFFANHHFPARRLTCLQ